MTSAMFKPVLAQDVIERKVSFHPISTGWHVGKCALCNDYKERAGFKFEDGSVIYNCWNCTTTSVYEEHSGKMSHTFKKILRAFGVDDDEISAIVNTSFFNAKKEKSTISLASLIEIDTTTPITQLPPGAFPLGHNDELDYQLTLVDYLEKRKVDLSKYNFFWSMGERFLNRIIIPFYRDGKLIYWQARSIDPAEKKRYDNSPVSRSAIMFNMDEINSYTRSPLFITEGVFDAMMVDGVAILGSKLNPAKKELLSRSNRRLVFVIDKDETGRHLAEEVLANGWEIAFSPEGTRDLNDSVMRFGTIWTINEMMKSICPNSDKARLAINVYCGGK